MKELFLIIFLILTVFVFSGCEKKFFNSSKKTKVLFLYTNDEHGHIFEKDGYYKAAVLNEMWEDEEKNCADCSVIKISGGDSYTGSAVSSVFKGESTAKIMKMLGYNISVLGNHEFDYGIDAFNKNREFSGIEYIAANLITNEMKTILPPSKIIEKNNIKIGFAGVTTEELKQVSASAYLSTLMVVKSLNSAEREFAKLSSDGAQILIALTHQSFEESKDWVLQLKKKPLIVFNAHSHDEYIKNIEELYFVQTGKYLNKYARIEVVCENICTVEKAEIIPIVASKQIISETGKKIAALTDEYLGKMEKVAGVKIGEAKDNISMSDFRKLFNCSNLLEFPNADVAICNPGAFRDELKKGVVKKSDIISILPFENRLVISELKGSDLMYNLELSEDSYCGAEKRDDGWYIKNKKIEESKFYKAVINDFMYNGGDKYKFLGADFKNSITSTFWINPVIKYISLKTKEQKTIEQAVADILKEVELLQNKQ